MKTKIILITAMIMAGAVLYAADTKQATAKTTTAAVAWERGTGHPNPEGQHKNFVDANKDGVSDRFVDANKDGKCDTFAANNGCCGGNQKRMGRNNTSGSGIGMKGTGKGRNCR